MIDQRNVGSNVRRNLMTVVHAIGAFVLRSLLACVFAVGICLLNYVIKNTFEGGKSVRGGFNGLKVIAI